MPRPIVTLSQVPMRRFAGVVELNAYMGGGGGGGGELSLGGGAGQPGTPGISGAWSTVARSS